LPTVLKGAKYNKDTYMELMALMYELLGKVRKEGLMSIEGDVGDTSILEPKLHLHVVAALRVAPARLVRRRGQRPEMPRRTLVLDDHLLIELFRGAAHRRISSACATPATRRSTSSCVLYKANDARVVGPRG